MMPDNISQTAFYTLIGTVITSLLGNIVLGVKIYFDQKNTTTDKRDKAEINAFNELSQLFKALKDEAESKKQENREREVEYEELEQCLDELEEKVRIARMDLLELRPPLKTAKRLIKELDIDDKGVMQILTDQESELTRIGNCLRV